MSLASHNLSNHYGYSYHEKTGIKCRSYGLVSARHSLSNHYGYLYHEKTGIKCRSYGIVPAIIFFIQVSKWKQIW